MTAIEFSVIIRLIASEEMNAAVDGWLMVTTGEIYRKSIAAEVPPIEVAAIAWHESRFCPYAVGHAGELGVLQVAPDSAARWCKAMPGAKWRAHLMCGVHLFALAKARCPEFPFTSFHTPAHCGPSRYETKIRATIERVTK